MSLSIAEFVSFFNRRCEVVMLLIRRVLCVQLPRRSYQGPGCGFMACGKDLWDRVVESGRVLFRELLRHTQV